MNRVLALGLSGVVGLELIALTLHDRRSVLWVSGVAVALVLLNIRQFLGHDINPAPAEPNSDPLGKSLGSWLSRAEKMIRWSESTRQDWDRHLRPILAGRFAIATGQRQAKDPAAFDATGRMLFGPELWAWVDPNNVSRTGANEPGPGRGALEDILQRLEQV
jgi:hypothetical protein